MYFSIIIPMYNAEKYIVKCIESILQQKKELYELILIDDGSTDKTVEIVTNYIKKNDNFILIKQTNKGPSAARNQGIQRASGDWIMFVDADDWLENDALLIMKKCLDNEDVDMLSFDYYKNSKVVRNNCNRVMLVQEYSSMVLCPKYHYGLIWSNVYSAKLLKKNKIFFNEGLFYSEDCEFMVKLCGYLTYIKVIDIPLYHYRVCNDSLSRTYKEDILEKYLKAIQIIEGEIKHLPMYNEMQETFFVYVRLMVIFIVLNSIFHPNNSKTLYEKNTVLKTFLLEDIIRKAMSGNIYKEFGVVKRFTLFCIKHKLSICLLVISYVKNRRG